MIAPILGAAIASGLQLHTQVVQTMQHEVCTLFYKYVVNDWSDLEIFRPRNIVFSLFPLSRLQYFAFLHITHTLSIQT